MFEPGDEVDVELWRDCKSENYDLIHGELIAITDTQATVQLETGKMIITSLKQISV